MIIYKSDGTQRATIEVSEDAEILLQVSDECSFTTKVVLSTFVDFSVGDYITLFDIVYHIAKKPTPTKHGTNKYEWTLKFVDARDYLSNVSLYLSDGTSLLPYDADTIYCYDAVCSHDFKVWRYVYPTADKNHTPTEDGYWGEVSAYHIATVYSIGAIVHQSNVVYRCIQANTGASLTNDTYWSVMNTAPMWDFATVLSPSDYAQMICDCMNRETTQHWVVGSCISSTPKEQSFANVQCLDAAASVAELFETEMFVDMSGTDYRLNFNRLAYIASPQLELAQGNGLFNISVQENTSAKKVTRLVALGGTKNLNGTYRNGSKRLMLPNAYYLDSALRDAADPHNATVTWDEIYPALTHATDDFSTLVAYQIGDQVLYGGVSYDCTTTHTAGAWNAAHFTVSEGQVTSVETIPSASTTRFKFIDEQLTFNPLDPKYIMADGTLPKVHFVTGNMAGYEFPVIECEAIDGDMVGYKLTIQQIQDSTDSVLPTVGYMFDVNDRYYFTDIYMPQSDVAKAELRLKARALDYLSKYEKDQITYSCTVDLGANLDLHKGEIVTLVDATFGLDADYRIVSLRRKYRKPYKYDITLSDLPYIPTRITKIENSIKQNETYIERNNLQSVMAKARTFQGAQEAINKAFDPSGDYFTNVIKPLIIETSAVLVGTNEQQYTLTGLEFTAITTNPNYLSWTAGSITDSRVEDTPRTWTIAAGNFTATSDTTAYYCYIRCERALGSTGATIIFDADQHLTKEGTTYYYFLLGTLTSLNDGFRQLWTSKGYTFINGDSIVTGKIQNTQGSVVIDLANETIHFGNIANTAFFNFDAETGTFEYKGVIHQSSTVVDAGGNVAPLTVDRGTWSDLVQYYVGNTVQYNGSTYYCKVQPTIGIVPTDIAYWNVIAIAGAAGADARVVSLTAAALGVAYDTAGANPSPKYISIYAQALNTSGTVYYEFFKNDVSVKNTMISSYSYAPQAAYADMPDKIEVQIRENSSTGVVLARDQITIVGQKAGSDAITAMLSNEAHTFAASNDGVVSDYTGSGTTIRVYEGTTELVYDGIGTGKGTWKVTAVSSGITKGLFTDSGTYCTVGDASDFADAAPTGYVEYTISGKNSAGVAFSLVKRQSFSKSYTGATGADAMFLDLTNESSSVACDSSGNVVGAIQGTTAILYKGATEVEATLYNAVFTDCTGTIVDNAVSVTALSADTATVLVVAIYNGISYSAVYTITKVYAGADGADAVIYWLQPSVSVVKKDADGILTPAMVSCTKKKQVGSAMPVTTTDYTLLYETSDGRSGEIPSDYSSVVLNVGAATWIEFTYVRDDTILDKERIPVVSDGMTGADARVVSLTAAALGVVYDTAGANPSPKYIQVIATALNTSGTVYYEFFKNGVSVKNSTARYYDYVSQAAYADMPDKIEVQIRENSSTGAVLARDQITIVGQKAGSDAITAMLSNEAHTFAASNDGVVSDYTGSGTTIRVYEGTTELVYDGIGTGKGTWKVTAVSAGLSAGLFTDSGTYCTVGDASDFADAAPTGYVEYTISGKNSAGVAFSLVKRQSFSKSYKGDTGLNTIYIYCENQNLSVSPSGSAFTKAIVIRLLSGGTPIPVASWTSKTKTLTGLTAAADGSSGNDWTINLTAFTTDTVSVGYVNVSIVYAGVTYSLSISVARIFNAVMINGKTWVSGATYIGSCLQRSVVKYGANWYALKTSVGTISSSVPPNESNDWEALNSFSNVATDSLFAEGANVANFIFEDGVMQSQAETEGEPNIILDGINGTGKIGRYRTDADGFKSGTPENWTNSADESDYVQLSPGVVRMQQSDSYAGSAISRSKVGFGEGADPDSIENFTAGYIYRRGSAITSSKMYKPALKLISDNAHNRDVAMYIEGAVPIFGGLLPSAYFMDADSVTVLDFSFGNNVIVKNNSYRSVYLPTRVLMGYLMNTTGSFAVEVKIIGAYNNTQNFLLSFQTGESTLYFRNNNGGLRGETIAIGLGDVVTIMLIYDGTNYYAQTMYVTA